MKIKFERPVLLFSISLWLGLSTVSNLALAASTGTSASATVNIGETSVLKAADSDNGNLLLAQSTTLSKTATINSLSFYVTTAKGSLRLGIYDATGPHGGPGALKAQTNGFTPTKGWNTANVITPVLLPAGTYWLTYLPSSNALSFVKENNSGACTYYHYAYGAMPSTYKKSPNSCTPTQWSFYATLTTSSVPPPASCGSTPSGSTVTETVSTTAGSTTPTTAQCPYGGTEPATTVVTQTYLCTNGTLSTDGSPVSTTTDGTPKCNAPASCGSTASGSTVTETVSTTAGSTTPTTAQCPYGGTEPATTVVTQTYLCTNGTLSTDGSPVSTTTDGTPKCNAPASCGSTASGSTVTETVSTTAGSTTPTTAQCPYGGTEPTTTVVTQTYLCTNGALSADGSPVSTTTDGTPACNPAPVTPVNGSCGSANGSDVTSAPSTNLCNTGTASSVTGSGPYDWSCAGSNGGTTASCSALLEVSGVCGSANGTAVASAPSSNLCSTGTATSVSGSGPWSWNCDGGNGGSNASCSAPVLPPAAVNGTCGSSNGTDVTSAPSSGLCSTGTATSVSGNGPFTWSCDGANGGTNASCSAQLEVNGTCGSANGVESTSAPSTNLCGSGSASSVNEIAKTLTWDWTCSGSNGGTTVACTAPVQPAAVNGTCGTANGVAVTSAPSSNLCGTGTATSVTGSGPFNWSCDGSNGGANASCSAPLQVIAVNGACGSANGVAVTSAPASNLCSVGTSTSVTGSGPWAWSCDGSNGGATASCSAPVQSTSSGTGTPTLIQHVASSANPVGPGVSGNNFKFTLPNPVGAGNVLILGISYPHGSTPTITDTNGNTWPTKATVSADAGSGGNVSSIFVLPNANAGLTTITVSFGSAIIPFEYTISEFNNVATVSPVNGTSEAANVSGPSLTTGSFTPGNNNSGGGNLIWNYYALSPNVATNNPTGWVAGSNFTLLDGDIAWINKQGFPHASEYFVQTTAAAINPSITATGDTEGYNAVSVALKAASAGTAVPSGIHVNKIIHESWISLASGTTLTLQLPTTGNLRVLTFAAGMNNIDITSITDSDGSTWHQAQTGGDSAQIWYAGNTSPDSNTKISIHTSGTSPTNSTRFFDVQGAAASPFEGAAGTDETNCSSVTSINDQPTITPTSANGLVIATMGIGDGPGLGVSTPSGAVWDLVTYSGEVDNDLMENADTTGHVYNTTTAAENWDWKMTSNGNNSCSSEAVAFQAAATTQQTETLTVSAGSNGTISPTGTVTVNNGANQLFTLTPSSGYNASLTVNGTAVTLSGNTYTLTDVTAPETLVASFTLSGLAVNGSCGSANGVEVASAPTTNLCGTGTASSVTESGTSLWDWNCSGTNGGSTAACSAPVQPTVVNGACGSANGTGSSSAPTSGLCSTGVATPVSGSGPWTWTCDGTNGGSNSGTCTAPVLVNGICGSANGISVSSAPTSNLCSTGTASSVTGSGPFNWTCTGANDGSTASCSAPLTGSSSDPATGILPAYNDASANWKNAGLLSVGGIPNRTTVCATVNPLGGGKDDFTNIQNAINGCPAGQVVQLGAGAFSVNLADLPIQITTGITLRGTGNCGGTSSPYCQTSITVANGLQPYQPNGPQCGTSTSNEAACPNGGPAVILMAPVSPDYNYSWAKCGNVGGPVGTGCGATPLAVDAAQGQTTIQVASTSGISVGQWVLIDEASGAGWQPDPLNATTGFGSVWAASDWLSSSGSPATGRVMWSKSQNGGGWDFGSTYPYQANSVGCWHSYCDRPTAELHKIASIGAGPCPGTGCTLTFDDPLTIAFRQSGGHNAQVYGSLYGSNSYFGGSPISFLQNAGVEDLSVLRGPNGGMEMEFCANCWIKNTEVGDWYNGGISIDYSARSELNTVYVHHCWDSVNSGGEYPIALDDASTEILITNSITNFGGKGMVARAGGAGSVVSYSYVDDTMYDDYSGIGDYWLDMGLNASHYSGPHHVLFEGDWADNLDNDNTHGNSMYMTFFRNESTGMRTPFTDPSLSEAVDDFTGIGYACGTSGKSGCNLNAPGPLRAAGPMAYNYWFAFVGNVLGLSGETTAANGWTYQGDWSGKRMFMLGWGDGLPGGKEAGGQDPNMDGDSGSYVDIDGNYDYVTNSVIWASTDTSHTLPNSLYLSQEPAFFTTGTACTYTWPWVTPTGSKQVQSNSCGGSGLPAKARYEAGTPFTQP